MLSIFPDEKTVKIKVKRAVEENDTVTLRLLSMYIENEFIESNCFDLDDGNRWIFFCKGVGVNSFSDINITFEELINMKGDKGVTSSAKRIRQSDCLLYEIMDE